MQCISCGKNILAAARVCPYCQRDTTESSKANTSMVLGGVVGGLIGYFLFDSVGWGVALFFAGAVVLGLPAFMRAHKAYGEQGAKVEVVNSLKASTPTTETNHKSPPVGSSLSARAEGGESIHAKRLSTLEEMKAKGFVTAEEYSKKRQQIIDEL